MASEFGNKYQDIVFDIDDGFDALIPRMDVLLKEIDPVRHARVREGYADIFKNIEFSSDENKEFLFQDLALALDLSSAPGWWFGPEEEFSCIWGFWSQD